MPYSENISSSQNRGLTEAEKQAIYKELYDKGEIDHIPGSYLDWASKAGTTLDGISFGLGMSLKGEALSWIPEVIKIAGYDIPSLIEKPTDSDRWVDLGMDAFGLLPIIGLTAAPYKATRTAQRIERMNEARKKYNTAAYIARKVGKGDDVYSLLTTPFKRFDESKVKEKATNEARYNTLPVSTIPQRTVNPRYNTIRPQGLYKMISQ